MNYLAILFGLLLCTAITTCFYGFKHAARHDSTLKGYDPGLVLRVGWIFVALSYLAIPAITGVAAELLQQRLYEGVAVGMMGTSAGWIFSQVRYLLSKRQKGQVHGTR